MTISPTVSRLLKVAYLALVLGLLFRFGILPLFQYLDQGNHPAWIALQHNMTSHVAEYISSAALLGIATICMMPELYPKTFQDWWTWARNSLQTAIPAARARHEASSQSTVIGADTTVKREAAVSTAIDPPTPPAAPTPPAPIVETPIPNEQGAQG